MISFGITGIIGSGKSTIAKIFEILGVPIYYADIHAKELMLSNAEIVKKLIQNFGNEVYNEGMLNKDLLGILVFRDTNNRKKINSIVHPVVIDNFKNWLKTKEEDGIPIAGIESALLYQSGLSNLTNINVTVISNYDTVLKRIMLRDEITRENAINKIKIQEKEIPDSKISDYVISNNEEDSIILQCLDVYKDLVSFKNNKN